MITVEVAYALAHEQKIVAVQVEEGSTAYEAVIKSRIAETFNQIDPEKDPMGIFGKAIKDPKKEMLKAGDRVEIYRPLIADPKEARAKRAAKLKAQKEQETQAE
ncbi:RnfH family protein [Marinobacterium sp. D7]|uniref:RnfH family protein n=1 Tax=Marinobacterium ramblicola TaxID=2849041 RepID=UPI001C2DC8E5|nr:RnfH family protein [Marinobacterium ramblicola]MBV1789005.1 RnfH family protein [Marinobacterium ramblicola]